MRVIESKIKSAIENHKDFVSGNTRVVCNDGGAVAVTLHGHLVAERSAHGIVRIYLCGWNTRTAHSRINAALAGFGIAGIYTALRDGGVIHTGGKDYEFPAAGYVIVV